MDFWFCFDLQQRTFKIMKGRKIMERTLYLGVLSLLTGIGALTLAGSTSRQLGGQNYEAIGKMSSLNHDERMSLLEQMGRERSAVREALIHQLLGSASDDVKFAAVFLLGTNRMEESVQDISRLIALRNSQNEADGRLPLWGEYPVVEALIRIGNPSIPAMLDNIRTTDDENVRKLSVRVIRYVEGPEIGHFVLQNDLEKRTDPQTKARLQAAIVAFDELVKATTAERDAQSLKK